MKAFVLIIGTYNVFRFQKSLSLAYLQYIQTKDMFCIYLFLQLNTVKHIYF